MPGVWYGMACALRSWSPRGLFTLSVFRAGVVDLGIGSPRPSPPFRQQKNFSNKNFSLQFFFVLVKPRPSVGGCRLRRCLPPTPHQDKEEEEGHRVLRGRWAPPPMEGKGSGEGQGMAIGQQVPPAADEKHQGDVPNPHPPCWCPCGALVRCLLLAPCSLVAALGWCRCFAQRAEGRQGALVALGRREPPFAGAALQVWRWFQGESEGDIDKQDLVALFTAMYNQMPDSTALSACVASLGGKMDQATVQRLLDSAQFQPLESGRYTAIVSLAEAESLRFLLHTDKLPAELAVVCAGTRAAAIASTPTDGQQPPRTSRDRHAEGSHCGEESRGSSVTRAFKKKVQKNFIFLSVTRALV